MRFTAATRLRLVSRQIFLTTGFCLQRFLLQVQQTKKSNTIESMSIQWKACLGVPWSLNFFKVGPTSRIEAASKCGISRSGFSSTRKFWWWFNMDTSEQSMMNPHASMFSNNFIYLNISYTESSGSMFFSKMGFLLLTGSMFVLTSFHNQEWCELLH
jgi:hypothetical protein